MNTENFYQNQLEKFQKELSAVQTKLLQSSILRFVVFALTVFLIYYNFPIMHWMALGALIGAGVFTFLLIRHGKLNYQKEKFAKLVKLNQLEIDIKKGDWSSLDTGAEFINPSHEFSYDVDLFGQKSFFQILNRTATQSGKNLLANLITSNDISDIIKKQKAIQNLSQNPEWRQDFTATASLTKEKIAINKISKWLKNHTTFIPSMMRFLPQIFTIISITLAVLRLLGIIQMNAPLLIWYLVGAGITGTYLKKINLFYENTGKSGSTFNQYYQLIELLENKDFEAELLKEKQETILNKKEKTSEALKKFANLLYLFEQRNNMIFGFLANGFFLWDLWQCYRIERWIEKHRNDVEKWFEVISFFDAYNSLANYAFNQTTYCYPTICEADFIIKSETLGHPLLKSEKRIDNDIYIKNQEFFIITGANMAGKSTFLRTVSLQIIMANSGLPVCAKSCEYRPIKLITSMRTSDSLADDSSYFFSELTQLKKIVTQLESANYFIILDEILKGTNSKDKAEGSYKFVKRLVKSNATGIIATHDLSLCKITDELEEVKNKYFDAQIINDELFFDYKFKEGVCQNMNASFLLDKMGIV